MRDELLKGLSEEQKKKLAECKSAEEVLALAKAEGVELNDEQLEAVSGGKCDAECECPYCGSLDTETNNLIEWYCNNCGKGFTI